MRYFLLLLFSAGVGLAEQITPPVWGWLYELAAPFSTVIAIIVGWRRASLVRKLALLSLALIVGWFASWSLHAIAHRPNNALAMRAGLILFGIRLAIGIWVLIPSHFAWKGKHANTVSGPGPDLSSGPFQHMTAFEAGAILGLIGGGVAGAAICKSHGMLAEVGGAIGGGGVGFFAGAFLVFPISFAYALAKIYWEVLTGRRKLPSTSSTTKVQRRRLLGSIAAITIAAEILLAVIYFIGSDAQRSRVPGAAWLVLGTGLIGLLILAVIYRRNPARKENGKDE